MRHVANWMPSVVDVGSTTEPIIGAIVGRDGPVVATGRLRIDTDTIVRSK
jgi:hypothetical protein